MNAVALRCPQCGASLPAPTEGFVVCQHCGSSLVMRAGSAASVPVTETPSVVKGVRFKPLVINDPQGTGLELFRMLAPVGWSWRGGANWVLDNPGMPATVSFQLWNPQGAEAFEILPNMNFFWSSGPMLTPIGSRHFGAEVRPPMSVREALRTLLLPRYRGSMSGVSILGEEPQPDLPRIAKSDAAISGGSAEGARIVIRYTWQGMTFDEALYGMVEVYRAPMQSMFGTSELLFWFLDFLFSFRAAAERLEASSTLFTSMMRSFRLNPQWYAAYQSIIQYLAQRQIERIQHIGQIGQMLAQTGEQMREQNLQGWYAKQEAWDRIATDRSRSIRGVDGYFDPHREEVVELPSGYGHAWANNLGEYIVTEDPNFNPNIGSNLHWEAMEQK